MAEERVVPTGPRGAVRATDDGSRPTVQVGEHVDPRDTSPIARNEPRRDEDIPKFGGGGVRIKAERAFWPKEQPDMEQEHKAAREEQRPPVHREHVVREGEVAEIPNEEAMDLMERGIVKRHKDNRNG